MTNIYTGWVYYKIEAENQEEAEKKLRGTIHSLDLGVWLADSGIQYEAPKETEDE